MKRSLLLCISFIVMDNSALEFTMDNQMELFGNAPIVFCGINNYTPSMLKGRSEVTGIVEAIDLAGTIEESNWRLPFMTSD